MVTTSVSPRHDSYVRKGAVVVCTWRVPPWTTTGGGVGRQGAGQEVTASSAMGASVKTEVEEEDQVQQKNQGNERYEECTAEIIQYRFNRRSMTQLDTHSYCCRLLF